MDFWVDLPVHSASKDSSRESETCSGSGQLLTAQQTEDEESAEERLFKAQHEVQSDSGTGEYPWFSFVDSSSTAKFLNVLIDELGKTTLEAALQPKVSMAAISLAAKTTNEYRLVEYIIKTAHLTDPPRRGLYVKSEKIALAALFLSSKVTNEHRLLEHVIKTALVLMDPPQRELDVKSELYTKMKEEIIFLESLLLQILEGSKWMWSCHIRTLLKYAIFLKMAQAFHMQTLQEAQVTRAAVFTVKIGKKLQLSTNSICTSIVYIHKFYFSFTFEDVQLEKISIAATFLAAKTTNEYRTIEHIIKTAHHLMDPSQHAIDVKSEGSKWMWNCHIRTSSKYAKS